MRIELTIDGGFAAIPGLAKPMVLDAARLSPERNGELERLVESALAEKGQPGSVQNPRVPDGRHYRISIDRGSARHDINADEPTIPPAFEALRDFITAHGHR